MSKQTCILCHATKHNRYNPLYTYHLNKSLDEDTPITYCQCCIEQLCKYQVQQEYDRTNDKTHIYVLAYMQYIGKQYPVKYIHIGWYYGEPDSDTTRTYFDAWENKDSLFAKGDWLQAVNYEVQL